MDSTRHYLAPRWWKNHPMHFLCLSAKQYFPICLPKHRSMKGLQWQEIMDSGCISKDMFPIYTVEKEGFHCLVDSLDSRYEMPSAKYFSSVAILALYKKTRIRVQQKIEVLDTEMWSSSTIELLLCTLYKRWPHGFYRVESSNTFCSKDYNADNLSEVLTETLVQWNIEADWQVRCVEDLIHLVIPFSFSGLDFVEY